MYQTSYHTTRGVLGFLTIVGWIAVAAGVLLFIAGLAAEDSGSFRGPRVSPVLTTGPAIALIVTGLLQVAIAVIGKAILDQADISRAQLKVIQSLAQQVGIAVEGANADSNGASKPNIAADTTKSDGAGDDLGFNEQDERSYKGKIIKREGNTFRVDGQTFSTLGQAKRHISNMTGI